MARIRAILFDLDGTLLVDGDHANRDAILRTCAMVAEAQPDLDPTRLFHANSEIWHQYWPEVESAWTLGDLDSTTVSLEAWRRTLGSCGCQDETLARFAMEMFRREQRDAISLYDDVDDVLARLSPGFSLGLITNGASDTQRDALRLTRIEHRFGAIIVSGEVRIAKPDIAVFRLALEKLGVAPEEALHVGDSPTTDVAGARAAGVTAVWLNRRRIAKNADAPEPDHEIASLTEIPGLL
jgi:putative hydrolase of the HAD superfamily